MPSAWGLGAGLIATLGLLLLALLVWALRRVFGGYPAARGPAGVLAPRELALGFSLGLIIGMTPFFGVHFVSCIFLAPLTSV